MGPDLITVSPGEIGEFRPRTWDMRESVEGAPQWVITASASQIPANNREENAGIDRKHGRGVAGQSTQNGRHRPGRCRQLR